MEQLNAVLEWVSGLLWGWPTLALLVGTGVLMTVSLRAMPWHYLPLALWMGLGPRGGESHGKGNISNRAALMTALAATVGTGNIAGVATAIALGGPGAMFWMWVSGLLGMAVKYSEALLGVYYRVKRSDGGYSGGPMYYLAEGLGMRWVGALYGGLLAFAMLFVGGMVQNNAMADAMRGSFGLEPLTTGVLVVVLAGMIVLGGITSIARVANRLVPTMLVVYLVAGTMVLVANAGYVDDAFRLIFSHAFNWEALGGGAAGAAMMQAMRYGLARGVFSNESGLGTAAVVAATAQTKHPAEQALVSMTQTFLDTIVVCTFTGLVILVGGAWANGAPPEATGAALTAMAFGTGFGNVALLGVPIGAAVVAVCLVLFSFTSVIASAYYGQQGAVYMFGTRAAKPYVWLFLAVTLSGAGLLQFAGNHVDGVHVVWQFADIAVALMIYPNLVGLWFMRKHIAALTWDYFAAERTGKGYKLQAFHAEPLVAVGKKKRGA